MDFDESDIRFYEIFYPGYLEKAAEVVQGNRRFAYYTSADTAFKIISNEELWFRNTTVMNDFSEISYGLLLIETAFRTEHGTRFKESVEDIFQDTIKSADDLLNGWMADWRLETYIACISVHLDDEDRSGRLSMWRAYGDTAVVVKNTPMVAVTNLLSVYSIPVMYLTQEAFNDRLKQITNNILINRKYLQALGKDTLATFIHQMLFLTAIGTKHPGFMEEQEWRLYYRPNQEPSELMKERIEVLGGVPQTLYALPLKHDPEHGLFGADIPSLLDRIIVGPTQYPYVSVRAFKKLLATKAVPDYESKVFASDIPLRTG